MDKVKITELKVPPDVSKQLGEFSSRTLPITDRTSIESQIPKSSYLIKALYFISQITIPLLWNLFVVIFIWPILTIRLYFVKSTPIFNETFRVSNFLSFNLICPLLIYNYFCPNNKNRKFYLLILATFEILTPDEVWQINQIVIKNKHKINGCLSFIIFRLIEMEYLSLDDAVSLKKNIKFIFTDYDSDRMIKLLVCLVVNKNTRIKLFPHIGIDDKSLRRVYKNKLENQIRNWTNLMSFNEKNENICGDARQLLYEYKLGFLSWVLFHRQMEGISNKSWKKICKEFDKFWVDSVQKTKELQDFSIDRELRVVFINVSGGQGMQSVEESFLQHFKSNPKMKFWYPMDNVESFLPMITCKKLNFKSLWNFGLMQKSPLIIQMMTKFGSRLNNFVNKSKTRNFFLEKIIKAINKGKKPDLIVNFVPFLTTDLQTITSKFSIPTVLYPTDMGFKGHDYFDSNDPNFFIRVPFIEYCYFEKCRFHLLNVRPGQFVFSGYAFKLKENEISNNIKNSFVNTAAL